MSKQQIIQNQIIGPLVQKNQAIGPLIFADKETFLSMLREESSVLIVYAEPSKLLSRIYTYISSVKGITFIVRSKEKIELPPHARTLQVKSIQLPLAPAPRWLRIVQLILTIVLTIGLMIVVMLAIGLLIIVILTIQSGTSCNTPS